MGAKVAKRAFTASAAAVSKTTYKSLNDVPVKMLGMMTSEMTFGDLTSGKKAVVLVNVASE